MWALLVLLATTLLYWSNYLMINSTQNEGTSLGIAQRVVAFLLLLGAGFSLTYAANGLA